ncbi:MAG TPA: DUF2784 domain-containing protein [Caulobacteraceae bacterium]|nr:DUF2784 domain-containing protein [Caulobacteraceae bacterium]
MAPALSQAWLAADLVLAAHLAVIAFNLFGLVAIPLGARLKWSFVRRPGWRLAHLASLAIVAAQAIAGRACFLTIWQDQLAGARQSQPLIMRWVDSAVFWPLPLWVFEAVYVAIFAYVVALFWLVPPRGWRRRGAR